MNIINTYSILYYIMETSTESQTLVLFESKQFLTFLSNVKNEEPINLLEKEIDIQKEKEAVKKDIYEGDILDGKKHGFGKMLYKNGNVYEGKWKNDKKHGKENVYSKQEIFWMFLILMIEEHMENIQK
jgi:hypothetical protein